MNELNFSNPDPGPADGPKTADELRARVGKAIERFFQNESDKKRRSKGYINRPNRGRRSK